ncbi:Z-ring formation inhibitor MciZ [Paenibacillus sp. SAF-054]|uniref:Z-ring formation inhibitor MciZ n=1 Tax=unclassified Paenibacillus TaxID=185978 RepID=UPI003F7FA2D2
MKSYRTKNSFHMVGQAWQIRIMLQQWMKETPPLTPLATLLNDPRRNGNSEMK